jgi:hypothetical protein
MGGFPLLFEGDTLAAMLGAVNDETNQAFVSET